MRASTSYHLHFFRLFGTFSQNFAIVLFSIASYYMSQASDLVTKYQSHGADTGSTKVQIALLTERITELTEHLKTHRKDFSSRLGLLKLVGKRRRLLNYLMATAPEEYGTFIKDLGLRK